MPNLKSINSQWNRVKDQAARVTDQALNLAANTSAQQSFLQEVDADGDGQITAQELMQWSDQNQDGYLNSEELKQLGIKAQASDLDRTTIKALGQAAHSAPQAVLFAADEAGLYQASESLEAAKDNFTTLIPHDAKGSLPSRDLKRLQGIEPGLLRIQSQEGNSCGTTSLSMLMKFYQGHTVENSVPTIDNYIRANSREESAFADLTRTLALDGFTAPRDIVNYAEARGFRAGMRNQSSIGEIKNYLDKGAPVMVLTDWNFKDNAYSHPKQADPDGASLHWVNIIGYEYQRASEAESPELHLVVANPHGRVQRISETDFLKVWSQLSLSVADRLVDTGMDRLLVAMVPRDEEHELVGPDGRVTRAGDISIPNGNDGLGGWLAKKASAVMQVASNLQTNLSNRSEQLASESLSGYARNGIRGLLNNLWNGDSQALAEMRSHARQGNVDDKALIINELLNKGLNRSGIQQLVYDILRDVPFGKDFDALLAQLDTGLLAERLQNDSQAGKVMAWIAKSEVDVHGKTGPKFEAFARQTSRNHRDQALQAFLKSEHTSQHKLLQKVPAATVRSMIENLMAGHTNASEETVIYELFRQSSWPQFEQIMSRLDMGRVASELEHNGQLGKLTSWVIESGIQSGKWVHLSEILNELESFSNYTRADDVLGEALTQSALKGKLGQIPAHLRHRMIDLLDDLTRWRTSDAVEALKALRKL